MTDTLQVEAKPLDTAGKREAIEAELRNDPNRSDREISRVIGCDHKTVGSTRERLEAISPLGNSVPTGKTREELLRAALPHDIDPDSPAFQADLAKVDRISEQEKARDAAGLNDDLDVYWSIPRQAAIECRPLGKGDVEIWQEGQHGDDDAALIRVSAANVVGFARLVLYAAGFRVVGMYTHEIGGNVDIEDGHLASNFYHDKPGYGSAR